MTYPFAESLLHVVALADVRIYFTYISHNRCVRKRRPRNNSARLSLSLPLLMASTIVHAAIRLNWEDHCPMTTRRRPRTSPKNRQRKSIHTASSVLFTASPQLQGRWNFLLVDVVVDVKKNSVELNIGQE